MVRSSKSLVVVPEQVKFHIYFLVGVVDATVRRAYLVTFFVQVGTYGVPSGSSISDHPCKTY